MIGGRIPDGNIYTGTSANTIMFMNLIGTRKKAKDLNKGWKVFVYSVIAFILACCILTIVATIKGADSSFINQEKLDELYGSIQAIIQTPYNTSKYDPGLEQTYNDVQKLLSDSFNLNFRDQSVYNDFVYGYHNCSNKQLVDLLNDKLSVFDRINTPESIRRLRSLLSIYDIFEKPTSISTSSTIMAMISNPIAAGAGIAWSIGFMFFYDCPIINNTRLAISSYSRYLKQKPIKENHSFFLSPKFLWTMIFVLIALNESIYVTYSIYRLTYNSGDYILTDWTWESIVGLSLSVFLFLFPMFYSTLIANNNSYVKQIESLPNIALQEGINTVHIKYKFVPWFQKADAEGRTTKTADELRIKLGLKPQDQFEQENKESKTAKSKTKMSNDQF